MADKPWEVLEREMSGMTSLLCCQGFGETKADSMRDNGWKEGDEHRWKGDTLSRMLAENLDYGKFSEDAEPGDGTHPDYMESRDEVLCRTADEWLMEGGCVCSLETAQAFASGMIASMPDID